MNGFKYLLLLILALSVRQSLAQHLRGTVRDSDRGTPLAGVNISLGKTADVDELAITTDDNGAFYTDALRPGYYRCFFTLKDYEPLLVQEVRIASGKEFVLDVSMRPLSTLLPDVTIKATPPDRRALQPLGEIPLTREQTLRFPATFFDPARLAMAYPGVANTDDQANGLSIRGNGPGSLHWRLEGVDIVNPNHTPNAGTLGDRPASASGGVLLFSAQLLDNSSLLTGAFPAGYGDALGGIMDMFWRRGNRTKHEFTAQAGLIGLDLAAEGPLDPRRRHSYLVNYRYSTVGLLGLTGITFGGEKINFQDLSFKLDFSGKKDGRWSVFGVRGQSHDDFTPPGDSAEISGFKDLFHIRFKSQTSILGASHWAPLGSRMWWKIAVVGSNQSNERRASSTPLNEYDKSNETRVGTSAAVFRKMDDQNRLQAGLNGQVIHFTGQGARNAELWFDGALPAALLQPWASWEWNSHGGKTDMRVGLHGVFFQINGAVQSQDISGEPRLLLTQRLGRRQTLALSTGLYSQLSPLWVYADRRASTGPPEEQYPNRGLGLIRSLQISLRHSWQPGDFWIFKSELFYQRMRDVPVTRNAQDAFSMLNLAEIQRLAALAALGAGANKGLELSAERYLTKGWFLLANATLLDARYRGSDDQWRNARWNLRHLVNLTAGKEWQRDEWPERSSAFGVNGRVTWAGGQYAAPVDTAASAAALMTVYDLSEGYSKQQTGFIRFDLRVYWRRNIGTRRNSMFAMDFQNASIRKNVAYRYYDPYTGRVETKEQLGFIPNLSWRLEW